MDLRVESREKSKHRIVEEEMGKRSSPLTLAKREGRKRKKKGKPSQICQFSSSSDEI
jgi:hypothetical protein